jgi:hypothetical protein
MKDPYFPYYVAGASLYILNLIVIGAVGCSKGLRPCEVAKTLALAIFFGPLGWCLVFMALKKRTGNYCCCGANDFSSCCVTCCCCPSKKKKKKDPKKDPKLAAAEAIMAKNKRDFFARNSLKKPGQSGGEDSDCDDGNQVAYGRPFFFPFGMQRIPDPYGPPLPTPYTHSAPVALV